MNRRHFLLHLGAALGAASASQLAQAAADRTALRVGGSWQMNQREYQIGALQVDWEQGKVTTQFAVTMPTLPHAGGQVQPWLRSTSACRTHRLGEARSRKGQVASSGSPIFRYSRVAFRLGMTVFRK